MSNPTAGWERVGNRFYRKIKLYDAVFDQDLELENYVIAGAPCSGAIGTTLGVGLESKWLTSLQHYTETRPNSTRTEDPKPQNPALTFTVALGSLYGVSVCVGPTEMSSFSRSALG